VRNAEGLAERVERALIRRWVFGWRQQLFRRFVESVERTGEHFHGVA